MGHTIDPKCPKPSRKTQRILRAEMAADSDLVREVRPAARRRRAKRVARRAGR